MTQLHNMYTMESLEYGYLTCEQKRKSLILLILLKEKYHDYIKGRACADGRRQRKNIKKEDSISSTVALESLLLNAVINVRNWREIVV